MGGGGLGGGGGAARLDDHDRLGDGYLAGGGEEGAGVADGLHIDHDRVGARVVAQVVDQVAPVDIQHRADGDEMAEADVFLQAPVQDGGAQRAALADEANATQAGHPGGEGGVQAADGTHHAQAVGADDAHPAAPRDLEDLLLQGRARRPGLLEAGGDDDRAGDAQVGAFLDQAGDGRRRGDDHGQIGLLRHGLDVRVGADAQHAVALGIDRVDRPAEGAADQVPEDGATDAADALAGANHGNIAREEDRIQGLAATATINQIAGRVDYRLANIIAGRVRHNTAFRSLGSTACEPGRHGVPPCLWGWHVQIAATGCSPPIVDAVPARAPCKRSCLRAAQCPDARRAGPAGRRRPAKRAAAASHGCRSSNPGRPASRSR